MNVRMDARTDDGEKVITIAHPSFIIIPFCISIQKGIIIIWVNGLILAEYPVYPSMIANI